MKQLAFLGVASLVLACGGATTTLDNDASTNDGGVTNDGSVTTDGGVTTDGASNDAPTTLDGGGPDSAFGCGAQTINLTFASCPAQPSCGGAIADGTYDYTSGCLPDPWGQAEANCQSLKVTQEKGTVQGCLSFAGGVVTQNVNSSYSAKLAVPSACLFNSSCTQLQSLLSNYFTATCTPSSGGCDCDVSSTYAGIGGVPYTTSNNEVVANGNHYAYCAGNGTLDMQWLSGPNPEPGVYSLTKQ